MEYLKEPLAISEVIKLADRDGLSNANLAKRAKVSPATISNLVNEKPRAVLLDTYVKITNAYNSYIKEQRERFGGNDE